MATVYRAPIDPPTPDYTARFDYDKYVKDEQEYEDALRAWAKNHSPGDKLAGVIWRQQIADGYANYMVIRSKPLQLVHIATGDAWQVSAPTMRGLRVSDIKAQMAWEASWKKLTTRGA